MSQDAQNGGGVFAAGGELAAAEGWLGDDGLSATVAFERSRDEFTKGTVHGIEASGAWFE